MDPSTSEVAVRLDAALEFSLAVCDLIMGHFSPAGTRFEIKEDGSPVTIADRGAEERLRGLIERRFPRDSILGEEFGQQSGDSGFRWVLDPIDGTKAFVHGVPMFGTLVGIELRGRAVAGVCRLPALGECVYAMQGGGAWQLRGDQPPLPARVSAVNEPERGMVCFTSARLFQQRKGAAVLPRLQSAFLESRGWNDCYAYVLVATGRAEAVADPVMHPWDVAALLPIIHEAGGRMSDWSGRMSTSDMPDALATNGLVHEATLRLLA